MGRITRIVQGAAVAGIVFAAQSQAYATTIVALTGQRTLVRIDLEDRRVLGSITVPGSESLQSIDLRPADGGLYGLFNDGTIAVLNPVTGGRVDKGDLNFAFPAARYTIDFNPVVDRLRIVGTNGLNLRANVDTLVVAVDTPIPGPTVIDGIAYTNSYRVAAEDPAPANTLLFDISKSAPATLYLQNPPNAGTLIEIGTIGLTFPGFGFDIARDDNDRNRGWLIVGRRLVEIDLTSGAVLSNQPITGLTSGVRDAAVLFD